MAGWTNQVTYECFGQNSKSSYLLVEGRTKPLISALDKFLIIPTYGWTNELSYL